MNKNPHLAVVGAGPAGASLAIRLARKNFRVTLIERERFPRHKLCGEFISPECLRHFRELEVFDSMLAAGGTRISETVFYAPNGKSVVVPSEWFSENEAGALSLSRAEMDFQLLERAKILGVEVLEECSVNGLLIENDTVRGVKIKTKNAEATEIAADLFVDATGRAAVLGKMAAKENHAFAPKPNGAQPNKLVGFKTHLERARVEKGRCEIYFFDGGYGGLSRVENDLANFCFLVRAETVKKYSSDAQQILEQIVFKNERAFENLKTGVPVHDWLAVSVETFGRKSLNPAPNIFAVGDAGAFIDPFTGSGMLMAFESAEILADAIGEDSSAEIIARKYQNEHARKFQKRLFVCSVLRRAAFAPAIAEKLIGVLSLAALPRKILARATRRREA